MSVAAVTIRIHYSKMVTMFRGDTPDMGDGHDTTEAKLLRRFRELITYCLGPRLSPDLIQSVLESMDVEITLFKKTLSIGINRGSSSSSTDRRHQEDTHQWISFPSNRSPYGQIALMIGNRSHKPEEYLFHY